MRKQNVSTESAKKQIANEKEASFASNTASSSAAPGVTVFGLADEISGNPPVSFTTCGYDVTLTIPAHHASDYALLKAEQIAALNRLISDRLSGCDVQITENELWLFAELASEMAHQTVELFSRAKDARDYPKGGV